MLSGTLGPPWKAVWSLAGKSKAIEKTFCLLLFYVFIDLTHIFIFLLLFLFYICISCALSHISSICLYSLLFYLLCVTTRSQTVE